MSDRNIIPSPSRLRSAIRDAMRCSPVHRVDRRIPGHLGDLLDRLDESEATHDAKVVAFRAGQR